MAIENCLYSAAQQQGGILEEEYNDAVITGVLHIVKGATDYASFVTALRHEFGDRIFPYADALWREARDQYQAKFAASIGKTTPELTPTPADYLPDLSSWQNYDRADVVRSLIESAARLAREGKVLPFRQTDYKPWSVTETEAKTAGFDAGSIEALKASGLPLDTITAALREIAGATQLRANEAATITQQDPHNLQAKLLAVQALKVADMAQLEVIKNAAEHGRALNYFKSVGKVLNGGSPTAAAFEKLFGTTNPKKPLSTGPNGLSVAESAQAPSTGQGTAFPEASGSTLRRQRQRNPKLSIPSSTSLATKAAGTQVLLDGMTPDELRSFTEAANREPKSLLAPPPLRRTQPVGDTTRSAGPSVIGPKPPPPSKAPSPDRVRTVKQVIADTPHLSDKLTQARALMQQAVSKLGSSANAVLPGGPPMIPAEMVKAARLYAEVYIEAGVKSFSEFLYHVRTQIGHTEGELPDNTLASAWKDAGGQGSTATAADAPEPISRAAKTGTLEGMDAPPPLSQAKKAAAGGVTIRTGDDAGEVPRADLTVPKVGEQTAADMNLSRDAVDYWQKWAKDNAEGAYTPEGAEGAPATADGRLDVTPDDTTRQRAALDRLGAQAQALAPVEGGGGAAPENGRLGIEDTTQTQRRAATDRLGGQAGEQATSPLAAGGGGEAGAVGENGQTALDAPGAGGVPLFLPDRAEAVRQRLVEEYVGPDLKRDPKIPQMLTEIGGYLYQQGARDFPEWCVRMNGAVGRKIAAPDLVNAYEQIKPEALNRVRKSTDIRAAAIKRAWQLLDTRQANEAIDRFASIDPKAPDAAQQYATVLREYRRYTAKDYLKEVPGLIRALQTSFDISAPFRQGLILTASRPRQSGAAFHAMLRSFANKDFGESVMREIDERPNAALYTDAGLALTKSGGDAVDLTQREESFMTNLIGDLAEQPLGGKQTLGNNAATRLVARGIDASERAYGVYLNRLRADVFDDVIRRYVDAGYTPEIYPDLYKSTARWINDATGRSTLPDIPMLGDMEKNAKLLSSVFFSARFQQSRLNVLTAPARLALPESAGGYHPLLRAQVARDLAGASAVILSLLGLAMLGGATVETDARSSDFGKARFGNTRVDVMGGLQQWIHLAAQLLTGQKMNSHGRVVELDGQGSHGTRGSVIGRFVESKLSPGITIPMKIASGQDYGGNTVYRGTPGEIAGDAARDLSPLYLSDLADGYQQEGAKGALLTLLQLVGMGVATYDDKPPQKRR